MYVYQMEIKSEEHMLLPSEIAKGYGLLTEKGQPHTKLIAKILEEYRLKNHLESYPVITYTSGWGPLRVYPAAIYAPAMTWFIQTVTHVTSYTFLDGKKSNFRLGEPDLEELPNP